MTTTRNMDSPNSAQPEARTFRSFDGSHLVYYVHGRDDRKGAAVILLHGLLSRASALDALGALLAKQGLRSYALDLRAHGASDAPRDPAAYRDQAMARDIAGCL